MNRTLFRVALIACLASIVWPAAVHAQLEARSRQQLLAPDPHARIESNEILWRPGLGSERLQLVRTSMRTETRFGETSGQMGATLAYSLAASSRVELQVVSAAGHGPRRDAELSLHQRIHRDWSAAAAFGARQADDGPATSSRVQLNRDFGRLRLSAGVKHERAHAPWYGVDTAIAATHTTFGSVGYAQRHWSLSMRYSELQPLSVDAASARSRTGGLTYAHTLRSSWQLNASVLAQTLVDSAASWGLRLGATRRF